LISFSILLYWQQCHKPHVINLYNKSIANSSANLMQLINMHYIDEVKNNCCLPTALFNLQLIFINGLHYVKLFHLTYDHPNGFTYLQLGRDFINLFYLNIWHFKTIHRTTFLSFWIFDFINKIENFHFIHIQGRL